MPDDVAMNVDVAEKPGRLDFAVKALGRLRPRVIGTRCRLRESNGPTRDHDAACILLRRLACLRCRSPLCSLIVCVSLTKRQGKPHRCPRTNAGQWQLESRIQICSRRQFRSWRSQRVVDADVKCEGLCTDIQVCRKAFVLLVRPLLTSPSTGKPTCSLHGTRDSGHHIPTGHTYAAVKSQ